MATMTDEETVHVFKTAPGGYTGGLYFVAEDDKEKAELMAGSTFGPSLEYYGTLDDLRDEVAEELTLDFTYHE